MSAPEEQLAALAIADGGEPKAKKEKKPKADKPKQVGWRALCHTL